MTLTTPIIHADVIHEPDETDDYEDIEDERLEKNGEMDQPDESRRGKEAQQAGERESGDEAVANHYESIQLISHVNFRWEKKGKETKAEETKLSTILRAGGLKVLQKEDRKARKDYHSQKR